MLCKNCNLEQTDNTSGLCWKCSYKPIEEFENKFVADNVIDCIPRKNWEEMKGEVETFINQALSQRDKEWEKKIWDMLFESFPSDMENFDLMLPDQAYRLLKTFWEKLKSLNK
jgi:hypothetical protein